MHKVISAAIYLFNRYRHLSTELARLETAKAYLQTVRAVRMAVLIVGGLSIFVIVTFLMLTMAHAAVLITMEDKLKAVLMLLGIDAVITAVIIWVMTSEKNWIKFSQSYRWFEEDEELSQKKEEVEEESLRKGA